MLNCANLTKELIEIPSFEGNEKIAAYCANILESHGIQVIRIQSKSTINIVAKIGNGKTIVTFNGHLDTVPPLIGSAINSEITSEKISGLGAVDMKSSCAAMICAFISLSKKQEKLNGAIELVLVGDEENGGQNGTKAVIEKGFIGENVIIGEPTGLKICTGQKSALQIEVITTGTPGHAARVKYENNAITKMVTALKTLSGTFSFSYQDEETGFNATTMNIGTIIGGSASNVVPAKCVAQLDFRFAPSTQKSEITRKLKIEEKSDVQFNEKFSATGWKTDKNTTLSKAAVNAIKQLGIAPQFMVKYGSNDARFYVEKGSNVINIGAGNNLLSHSGKEEVDINEIRQLQKIYELLALDLLNTK